jgi:hypothetical protein
MMQSIRLGGEKETHAWGRLREALRVDRGALDYVKRHSDFPRHGKPWSISNEERARVFTITDEVIRRYLEWLVRGKQPLPETEFSVFSG